VLGIYGGRVRECIFCGGGPLTKEHVIPAWLSTVLPGEGSFEVERLLEPAAGGSSEHGWSAPALNLTARCVCAGCNNGWMSDLEDSVRPLITPMINGRACSLSRDDQTALALWLAKTVAMCEQAVPGDGDVIPSTWHKALYEARLPPAGVWAWLARYRGGEFRGSVVRSAQWYIHPLRLTSSRGDEAGLSVVLSLGQLVFQFMAVFADDPEAIAFSKEAPFLQLWPEPLYRAPWPPSACPPLDDAALESLALSFAQ
jgi:hypothetical protein